MKGKTYLLLLLSLFFLLSLILCCNSSDDSSDNDSATVDENFEGDDSDNSASDDDSHSNDASKGSTINYKDFMDFGVGWTGFSLFLMDAPIDFVQAVYITFNQVQVQLAEPENNQQEAGWIELPITPTRYNMLDLQNNAMELLSEDDLPNGQYASLRFMFDCSNGNAPSVLVDDEEIPLNIPSGCETGLKVSYSFNVGDNEETSLLVDFDMRKSIIQLGNDDYVMTPVMRTLDHSQIGVISGQVLPTGIAPVAYAFDAGTYDPSKNDPFKNAINSTMPRVDGTFSLGGLPEGNYDVVVTAEGYQTDTTQTNIEVIAEQETQIPTISMMPE